MNLIDSDLRAITYLRISLTQRCNMKCGYCFSSSDSGGNDGLSERDIIRIIQSFALLGIEKIRFTGGEPLLRKGIARLISLSKVTNGIKTIGITTNGLMLERLLPTLIDAGLDSINVSLDSLNANRLKQITGIDCFDQVTNGITAALESRAFARIKINTVVMRGINDGELQKMARWALERGLDIRFIEFMPTGKSGWRQDLFVSEGEIQRRIGLPLERSEDKIMSPGPAVTYCHGDYSGRVSFISAVSRSFCAECNRIRLSSRGEIYGCLFQDKRADLNGLLGANAGANEIAEHIKSIISLRGFRRSPGASSITEFKPLMQAVGG